MPFTMSVRLQRTWRRLQRGVAKYVYVFLVVTVVVHELATNPMLLTTMAISVIPDCPSSAKMQKNNFIPAPHRPTIMPRMEGLHFIEEEFTTAS